MPLVLLAPKEAKMQISKAPLFKLATCLVLLAFTLGGTTAAARVAKDPKPGASDSAGTAKYKGNPFFLGSLDKDSSSCASSCCKASADCPVSGGATTSCTETGCSASCAGGARSYTACAKLPAHQDLPAQPDNK